MQRWVFVHSVIIGHKVCDMPITVFASSTSSDLEADLKGRQKVLVIPAVHQGTITKMHSKHEQLCIALEKRLRMYNARFIMIYSQNMFYPDSYWNSQKDGVDDVIHFKA